MTAHRPGSCREAHDTRVAITYHRIPVTVPKPILALFALLGLVAGLSAKPTGGVLLAISPGQEQEAPKFELVGQIESEPGVRLKGFFSQVILRGAYHPFLRQTVTNLGGVFKFKKVGAGTYVLTATTPRNGTSTRTIEITPSFADSKGRVRTSIQMNLDQNRSAYRISVAALAVPDKAWKEYLRAQDQLSRSHTDAAIKHLKRALKAAPEFPTALNSLGTICYQTGKYKEAEEYFKQALDLDPDSYPPLVNLGGALLSLGQFEKALQANLRALERRPSDPLAHFQLGLSYEGLGEWDKAITSLQEAKRLEPTHFTIPQLSIARLLLKKGRLEASIKEYEEFLFLHPDSPHAAGVRRFIEGVQRKQP